MTNTRIRHEQINSENATDGYVLTSDGASGTAWEAQVGGGGSNTLAIYGNNTFKVSGTAAVFNDNLTVSTSGTFAYVNANAGVGAGLNAVGIFDDSVFKVSGTAISFNSGLYVSVTGTVAYINTSGTSSSGGGTKVIRGTASATAQDAHTTNSTWEDINSMAVTITTEAVSDIFCLFTFLGKPDNTSWEHVVIRFALNSTGTASWNVYLLNGAATTTIYHSFAAQYMFTDILAGTHTIKVQWYDDTTGLDYSFYDRRLSVMAFQDT